MGGEFGVCGLGFDELAICILQDIGVPVRPQMPVAPKELPGHVGGIFGGAPHRQVEGRFWSLGFGGLCLNHI